MPYAEAISRGVTFWLPSAIEGYAGRREVMPIRFAVLATSLAPSSQTSRANTVLTDERVADSIVM